MKKNYLNLKDMKSLEIANSKGGKPRSSSGCLLLEPYKRCVLFGCVGVMPVRRLKHEKPLVY